MKTKRFLSVILAVAMLLTVGVPAFADVPETDAEQFIVSKEIPGETEGVKEDDGGQETPFETQEPEMDGKAGKAAPQVMTVRSAEDEVSYSTDGSVWTSSSFDVAWEAANAANTATEIKILKDITLSKSYKLDQSGASVCIYAGTTDVRMTAGSPSFGFQISNGILELGKESVTGTLTIDGGGENNRFGSAAFQVNPNASNPESTVLTLRDGVVITNFYRAQTSTSYYGLFYNNGTLNINGGNITGNTITSSNDTDGLIFTYRTLNVSGGEISNNSGGVVIMVDGQNASLNMTGGKIINNDSGFKLCVVTIASGTQDAGSATISGGKITGNSGMFKTFVDIQAGKNLTALTLNGDADIGSIGLDNGKYLTIETGFNPPSPIELVVNGSGNAEIGDKFADVGALDVTGQFTYRNNSFTPNGNGTLGEYVTPAEETYSVTTSQTAGGTVTTDKQEAKEGDTITITATPEKRLDYDAYAVTEIKVTGANGTDIDVTGNTFVMPAQNVTVSAVFARKISLQFYANNRSGTIDEINDEIKNYGKIEISPEPHSEEMDLGFMTKTQIFAYNGESYTLTATANEGVAVTSIYLQGAYTKDKIEGTISDDGKTATLILTEDFLKNEVEKDDINTWPIVNLYVTFENPQTLTVGKQKNGVSVFNIGTKSASEEITTDSYSGNLEKGSDHKVLSDKKVYLYAVGDNFKGFKLTNTQTGAVIAQTPVAIGWTQLQHNGGPYYYSFTMPNYGVTVELVCEYSVSVSDQIQNGSVTATPEKADVGQEINLTVTPDTNYELESLTVYKTGDPSTSVNVKDNKFTMPEYNVTVSATFKQSVFAVNIAQDIQNGTISADRQTASAGDSVKITASPAENYTLNTITATASDGNPVSVSVSGNTGTFTMPASEVTVTAEFEKSKYTVEIGETENGSVTLLDNPSIAWGETVSFMVNPNEYYELDTLAVKDSSNQDVDYNYDTASSSYSFMMPTSDVSINAVFKKKQYSVTTKSDNVTFGGLADKYTWGDVVEFTVTPDEWYNITSVTATGGVQITDKGNGTYSFTMPSNDIEITVVAMRPNFSIIFNSRGGSTVDPKTVANGEAVEKPAVPERANYGFAGWYTNAECTEKYDFSIPVTRDLTLYARWFLWGDVNGDGVVNASDALIIQRCRIGAIEYQVMKNQTAAFVNGIGREHPNATDALLIQRYRLGNISRFPVETSAKGYEFDLENNTYFEPGV